MKNLKTVSFKSIKKLNELFSVKIKKKIAQYN